MATITLVNPWSKAIIERDSAEFVRDVRAYAQIDETLASMLEGNETAAEIVIAEWADLVGPDAAGVVLIGS